MLGKQDDSTDLFQMMSVEDLVPAGHPLRKLKAALDLTDVVSKVAACYAKIGRPSYDPVLIARIWVLQYLYGLSERQVCDEIRMHAGFRWFCGLSFNDAVPDQSTLVKLRTKKWNDTDFWQHLLDVTVRACEAAGICKPDRMAVDGTLILANAATVSLEEIAPELTIEKAGDPEADNQAHTAAELLVLFAPVPSGGCAPEPPEPPAGATPKQSGRGPEPDPASLAIETGDRVRAKHKSGDPDWHGEKFSNATHRSTTDPESRLYRKGHNQEAKLRYIGHYMAEVASGVIYAASATQATGYGEREAAIALLDRLGKKPTELVADLGYRNGSFLADILERGVQPIVPIGDEPQERVPIYERRTFDLCRAARRANDQRDARARNATRLASRGRPGARAQRQRTRLEHLFAEAKNNHGLARARGRGLCRVDQQVKLTAAVQNMKRLMNARRKRQVGSQVSAFSLFCRAYSALFRAPGAHVRATLQPSTSFQPQFSRQPRCRQKTCSPSRPRRKASCSSRF